MADGVRLAARVWIPEDAEKTPVPAILEYLPYRKRDGTIARDEVTHPFTAGHGYACVRVDTRGSGESEGLMFDEYILQEQDDALEIIDWLSRQPWCDGNVGMMGISWGGFNGLQVAARRPPALKAVITLCSTVDRYADDIHYKGGGMLAENLGWSATMLSFSSRPPDPELVGGGWRDTWRQRLEEQPHLAEIWFEHQHRDSYWEHGSVCKDWPAIEAAVLAVGAWSDSYQNAVPELLTNLEAPCAGIIGPWIHKYPHLAKPEPRINFLREALRWWDRWLKGHDTRVENDPVYRVYCQDPASPEDSLNFRPGRWVSEAAWPSGNIAPQILYLNEAGLQDGPEDAAAISHHSPEDTGTAGGEYCAMWLGPELPGDQRGDDAGSLVFDTEPLKESLEILGTAKLKLRLSIDQPQGNIIVRLCGVDADGTSERVSFGVLNLCHRASHADPAAMPVGEEVDVTVVLDHAAHRFAAGQRIRVAISTAYWPMVLPSPAPVTLTLSRGVSSLSLPVRHEQGQPTPQFDEPEPAPGPALRELRPGDHRRNVSRDSGDSRTRVEIVDDFGQCEDLTHGLITGSIARETHEIDPDDPCSARIETHWTQTLERGDWQVRTETFSEMTCDSGHFHLSARLEAFEGGELYYEKSWKHSVPRKFV